MRRFSNHVVGVSWCFIWKLLGCLWDNTVHHSPEDIKSSCHVKRRGFIRVESWISGSRRAVVISALVVSHSIRMGMVFHWVLLMVPGYRRWCLGNGQSRSRGSSVLGLSYPPFPLRGLLLLSCDIFWHFNAFSPRLLFWPDIAVLKLWMFSNEVFVEHGWILSNQSLQQSRKENKKKKERIDGKDSGVGVV